MNLLVKIALLTEKRLLNNNSNKDLYIKRYNYKAEDVLTFEVFLRFPW